MKSPNHISWSILPPLLPLLVDYLYFSLHCNPCKGATKGRKPGVSFSKVLTVTGPKNKLFFVCRVHIQDQDINSFKIQTTKISGNEIELRLAAPFLLHGRAHELGTGGKEIWSIPYLV